MKRVKIKEYPYRGKIIHVQEGSGMNEDSFFVMYEGEMDLFKREDLLNNELDTTKYIIYVPYIKYIKMKPFSVKNENGKNEVIAISEKDIQKVLGLSENQIYIPNKGDRIEIYFYDDVYYFDVDNSIFSQLDGIEIYVTRSTWDNGI